MLTFLGGVFYGIIAVVVLVFFLVLTMKTCLEHASEDFLFDEDTESFMAFCEVIERLGVTRFLIALATAFFWPVSITLFLMFTLAFREKYLDELPTWARNLLLWVFLGFGKFKPQKTKEITA